MNDSKFDSSLFVLALSSLNNQQLPCFQSVLGCFHELLDSTIVETANLKKSFLQVRELVEVWLENTHGILHHRILHFQLELDSCYQVIYGLPKKINNFWKKQLTLLCVKIKNLFAQKAEIAMCAKNFNDPIILKTFRERQLALSSLVPLNKNLSVCSLLGIDVGSFNGDDSVGENESVGGNESIKSIWAMYNYVDGAGLILKSYSTGKL